MRRHGPPTHTQHAHYPTNQPRLTPTIAFISKQNRSLKLEAAAACFPSNNPRTAAVRLTLNGMPSDLKGWGRINTFAFTLGTLRSHLPFDEPIHS